MKVRILFICMGNICRSPAAEGVLLKKLEEEGLSDRVLVDSAGTIGFHAGAKADSRMRASATKRGYDLQSRSRQIQAHDFDDYDWLIVMDFENQTNVARLAVNTEQEDQIKMFCSYCESHSEDEVPDPYYGGDQGFEHVLDLLEDGCAGIIKDVRQKLDASF